MSSLDPSPYTPPRFAFNLFSVFLHHSPFLASVCPCLYRCLVFLFSVQAEKLRNLIVSEAADWQVLTLRLATQLESLKRSMSVGGADTFTDKSSEQVLNFRILRKQIMFQ